MRTYDLSPLFRSSVGFDRWSNLFDTALRAGDNSVVIENNRPVFVDSISCNDCRPCFVTCRDDLKKEVAANFIDGHVAEFIYDQKLDFAIFLNLPR